MYNQIGGKLCVPPTGNNEGRIEPFVSLHGRYSKKTIKVDLTVLFELNFFLC
jgi:hypothetical protein